MLESVCDDFRAHRRNWRPQGLREMPAINRLGSESAQDVINMAPEQHLYSIIDELAKSDRIVSRLRNEPLIDGIRGKDSKNYASGINLIKYLARSSRRMLFPQ